MTHTELVVVALAAEDDVVRQYSSEKEPHLTLLYLGESDISPADLAHITEYVGHAASQISAFGMEVDRRGVLGPKNADVLFFHKRWAKDMEKFRANLLQNELINKLFRSAFQWPEWTPHLTMGFPDKPAKPDKREYRRYSYVRFDRIALWTGDSSGPTFELKDYDMEVAMAQEGPALAASILADLEVDALQYGVPGMKWGRRKDRTPAPGSGKSASSDATRAAKAKQIAKRSGVKALSNEELQALVTRMNLEQQLGKLTPPSRAKKARMTITKTLARVGDQQLNMVLNQAVNAQIAGAIAKAKK